VSGLRFAFDTSRLTLASARFAGVAGTTMREGWTRFLLGLSRRVVGITPPASGQAGRGPGGAMTTEDKQRGERALARDLESVFVPVERAQRNPLVSSDPGAIHRRLFVSGKTPGKPLKNDREQAYLVDATALRALARKLRRKVGRLAGQWNSGIESVGGRSPAWVARHGHANGKHRLVFSPGAYHFEMSATDVPNSVRAELLRRIGYAERYQRRAGERAMKAILLKAAGRAGFATSA
jgi:hypothetical protein